MSQSPTLDTAATTTHGGQLSRSLGVGGNVLITLSGISPASSVFILGGAALAGYGTGVFWGFLLAGVISILIAFCYAELASRHPIAGGDYSLVSRVLGPSAGAAVFFIGLVSLPLIIAIFALGVADYLGVAIAGLDPLATALIVIVLATVTACFNIRANAWVTGAFLFVEMAALVLLAVLGFVHVERPITELLDPQALDFATGELAPLGIAGLVLAVTQGIFSYNGYGGAVYFAEETKNARRAIARAVLWSAIITVIAELVPLTAVLLGATSLEELFGAELPVETFLGERAGDSRHDLRARRHRPRDHQRHHRDRPAVGPAAVRGGSRRGASRRDRQAARASVADDEDADRRDDRDGRHRPRRVLHPVRRAAQRHRLDARLQLRLHRARRTRGAPHGRPGVVHRLPHAAVARTARGRAHRDRRDLRDRHPRPRAVAEPRHRLRHRRGRVPLLRALPAPQPRCPAPHRGRRRRRSSSHDARHPHHRRPRAHVRPGSSRGPRRSASWATASRTSVQRRMRRPPVVPSMRPAGW